MAGEFWQAASNRSALRTLTPRPAWPYIPVATAAVAQRLEHRVVVPGVGGSIPLGRPTPVRRPRPLEGGDPLDHEAVLFANEAFYRAFAARDLPAMEEVWARHCPVACIHPGWGPLHGREAVMRSWAGILGNPQSPVVTCLGAKVVLFGDTAMVTCFETLTSDVLIATNLFVRQGHLWKLVHHQAGPTSARPEEAVEDSKPGRPN